MALPSGVSAALTGSTVVIKGPKGEEKLVLLPEVTVTIDGATIVVTRKDNSDDSRARHGLTRMLIANAVKGVSDGYEKKLEIIEQ